MRGFCSTSVITELLEITKIALPMYDPPDENPPESVRKMFEVIYEAERAF